MPLIWERAFGGTDTDPDGGLTTWPANPIGRGYAPHRRRAQRAGLPLPNLELPGRALTQPLDDYPALGCGLVARHWWPRAGYGGTYDAHWRAHKMPYLPDDFDTRFYQCAPPDQQIPYLAGGEPVELINLHPAGPLRFRLPHIAVPMAVIRRNGERQSLAPVIDTLTLLPDAGTFTLVWRASIPLRFGTKEIATLLVGQPTPGWERARMMGKPYVPLTRLCAFAARRGAAEAAP